MLLVKKERELDFDEHSFYKNDINFTPASNQLSFAQTCGKEFREFRLVEIVSDVEVREHLVFVHPFYLRERQRIYFDSKNQFMLEKHGHPRVFLYEKEENKMKRTIKWKCLRRFTKFPEELENESGFLRCMSPTFHQFIDIDRQLNRFVIRDTFSHNTLVEIP